MSFYKNDIFVNCFPCKTNLLLYFKTNLQEQYQNTCVIRKGLGCVYVLEFCDKEPNKLLKRREK